MTDMTNISTMIATGGKRDFTAEEVMKTARSFHHAAGELEALHRRTTRRQSTLSRWVPVSCLVIMGKTSIGRHLLWLVSNGLHRGRHLLFGTNPLNLQQVMGRVAGAVVLEALAVELVLKARLKRTGISLPERGPFCHRASIARNERACRKHPDATVVLIWLLRPPVNSRGLHDPRAARWF